MEGGEVVGGQEGLLGERDFRDRREGGGGSRWVGWWGVEAAADRVGWLWGEGQQRGAWLTMGK